MHQERSPQGPTGTRPSAAARALHITEAILAPFVYPKRVEDYLREVFPLLSQTEVLAEVVGVRRETKDTTTLVLRPNGLFQGHRAGQWITLESESGGTRRTRCFSISSAPSALRDHASGRVHGKRTIEVTIKAVPGGAVTPALVWQCKPGEIVTISQAQGSFTLPEELPARPLFVSGGSGITPVMSMLRELALRGKARGATFVHYARTEADVVFAQELSEHALFSGVEVLVWTDEEPSPHSALTGRCDVRADLLGAVPDFAERETFACGPPGMLAALGSLYREQGASARLHTEAFTLTPLRSAATGSGAASEEGSVHFARANVTAEGPPRGRTLLAMAESAGLTPKSGCRMGICHTCTCRKTSGTTRDVRTGELSTDANQDIRLCVSEPVGNVTLDI
jgi:ferredoxin-NADP reductase